MKHNLTKIAERASAIDQAVYLSDIVYERSSNVDNFTEAAKVLVNKNVSMNWNGYEVTRLVNVDSSIPFFSSGHDVLGFKNLQSGELFVVARGTDDVFPDVFRGWLSVGIGDGITGLSEHMASAIVEFSEANGDQKVIAAGHSYGGHAAELAGFLVGEYVDTYVNNQGPGAVQFTFFPPVPLLPIDTPFGKTALLSPIASSGLRVNPVEGFRLIGADTFERDNGVPQRLVDFFGTGYDPTRIDFAIDVNVHSSEAVARGFNTITTLSYNSLFNGTPFVNRVSPARPEGQNTTQQLQLVTNSTG